MEQYTQPERPVVIPRAYATPRERTLDGLTREAACIEFQPKILRVARKLWTHVRDDAGITLDDLVSYGVLGLLEAFDRYEPGHGIVFAAFAEYRIRGAMLDALRTMDTFTRRRRDTSRRLKAAEAKVREAQGRDPVATEVAAAMGASMEEYWTAIDVATPVALLPIDDVVDADGFIRSAIAPDEENEAPTRIAEAEARIALRRAILALPERERQVILLYYARDMNLAEIGEVLAVTPSRICQVLAAARGRLRAALLAALSDERHEEAG
jgi:RNA polymerase sigma factor FliA